MSVHPPNDDVEAEEAVIQQDPPSEGDSVADAAPIRPDGLPIGYEEKLTELHQRNVVLLRDIRRRKTVNDAAMGRMRRNSDSKDARFATMKSSLIQRAELA